MDGSFGVFIIVVKIRFLISKANLLRKGEQKVTMEKAKPSTFGYFIIFA